MSFFHVYLVRFVLIDALIALMLEVCFRILRDCKARMKRRSSAKVPLLGITGNSLVLRLPFVLLAPTIPVFQDSL